MNIDLINEEMLKLALDSSIIDIEDVKRQLIMKEREELLSQHPWSISEGKDGKWRTYLPDKERGRKMVKRTTKKAIEDVVIEFYKQKKQKSDSKTFDDVYHSWRKVQDNLVCDNSIAKYNTDYKRYFENSDFSKKEIEKITEEDIKVFICNTVKSKKLCKKACKTLFGYIRNTINSARINKLIKDNPMEFLAAKQFYTYCTEIKRPKSKIIVSDEDMVKLYEQFYEDYKNKPEYIPTYAVHLATLTGMRVGELSALSWDCITDSYIIINKSEKYNRITKEYFIDETKNKKERIFPITDEIRNLLNMIKSIELSNGYISKWVFSNDNGRVHANIISSCLKNKCIQLGIDTRGIHALRRTVNSKMRCDGVSSTVAASLLGHTSEVNEQYYTFDISTLKEKATIISKINSEMKVAN